MRVDEPGADQLATRVDLPVDGAIEAGADVDDPILLEHDDAVADQRVGTGRVADDPAAPDERPHQASFG